MGQYKVPQDVEAEDKILGPLTFKQFIYALIGVGWAFLSFILFRTLPVVMVAFGAPVVLLFLLLAFYRRDGQNFEQLLIALVGFFSNARVRFWIKEEAETTFHVTPRKVKKEQSQRDPKVVRSELDKVARLIDSRGWNHDLTDGQESVLHSESLDANEERLVARQSDTAAETVPDVLDLNTSPLAQNLSGMLDAATQEVRQQAVLKMAGPGAAAVVANQTIPDFAPVSPAVVEAPSISVTTPPNPNILKLATESELTVSQLANTANRLAPLANQQAASVSNGQ